jgi:hypothetical protein
MLRETIEKEVEVTSELLTYFFLLSIRPCGLLHTLIVNCNIQLILKTIHYILHKLFILLRVMALIYNFFQPSWNLPEHI